MAGNEIWDEGAMLVARFRQEEATRTERLTRALAAAKAVLARMSAEYLPVPVFLDLLEQENGADRLSGQEIRMSLQSFGLSEETVLSQNDADPVLGIRPAQPPIDTISARRGTIEAELFPPLASYRNRYPCLCCGNYTMTSAAHGSYDICDVCFWEDDRTQTDDPNFFGGANVPSLNHARLAYAKYGACEARLTYAVRRPHPAEKPEYRAIVAILTP